MVYVVREWSMATQVHAAVMDGTVVVPGLTSGWVFEGIGLLEWWRW